MTHRRYFLTVFFTGVLFVAGIAFAEWLAEGSGNGTAKAGTAAPLTVSGGTPTTLLLPDGTGDVALRITNPNPYPVTVTSIDGDGTITADATHATAGCTPEVHGVTFTDQVGSWVVGADAHLDVVLADAATMALTSDNACQGATFTIPLAVTGANGGTVPDPEPVACTDDPLEQNDAFATSASLGTVNIGGTISRTDLTLCPAADDDWYRVTAAEGVSFNCFPGTSQTHRVTFELTVGAATGPLTLRFYAADGTTLLSSVSAPAGQTTSQHINWSGSCGTDDTQVFRFLIEGAGSGPYQLLIRNTTT